MPASHTPYLCRPYTPEPCHPHTPEPCHPHSLLTPPPRLKAKRKRARMGDLKIVVAGCVAQQEGQTLLRRVPEVDIVMGECVSVCGGGLRGPAGGADSVEEGA